MLSEVKSQVLSLTEEVSQRETAYHTLEQDHRKSLKCIHSLRAYMASLPALDEVRELRTSLDAKTAQCKDADSLVLELEKNLKVLRVSVKAEQDENLRLQVELKEVRAQNAALGAQLREAERTRYEARNLDEGDVENVLFDLAELRLEADRLRSLASWKEKRFDQAKQQLEEQVRRLSNLLEQANVQVRDKSAGLRQSEAGRRSLDAQLADANKELERAREELEKAQQEVRDLQVKDQTGQEIGILFSRISR